MNQIHNFKENKTIWNKCIMTKFKMIMNEQNFNQETEPSSCRTWIFQLIIW
jgi:hypothetical protein